jgi:amino acid adenylation domain-containing protein
VDLSRESCVQDLIAEQARATPEAIALEDGGRALSYRALDQQANRLALRLIAEGVQPEEVVGVLAGRSAAMVISLLAIHKAGAAYLPLDPSLPADRRAYMIENARARRVITLRSLWSEHGVAGATPILFDQLPLDGALDGAPPDRTVSPDQLAYVIYTSGSTGQPKGIEMPHRLLVNLLAHHRAHLPAARTAQYASFFFDVSFQDICGTLATGGTVVTVADELRIDFPALCRFLEQQRIERIFMPVVALIELAEAVRAGAPVPSRLREVVTAGEQLKITPAIRELFARLGPTSRLHNHYGPAETHVVTDEPLAPPADSWPKLPSIGRAIDGARIYLLDQRLEPVPSGSEGELYIGAAVSRGYRGRAHLTAERFLPDPFSPQPGARMYKSGDLAVLLPDGRIEFRGRADLQVKIRGFRVEPEEIELALAACPGVAAAAVIAAPEREDDELGEKRLIACVVPGGSENGASADELRRRLGEALPRWARERLPEYMVPAQFVLLDALPLTPSGKIDRLALKALSRAHAPSRAGAPYDAPQTATEKLLARIWQEVLGVDRVGIKDDFFLLGGNSLRAVRMITQLRDLLDLEVSLQAMFDAPTIEEFSRAIRDDPELDAEVRARAEVLLAAARIPDRGAPEPTAARPERTEA